MKATQSKIKTYLGFVGLTEAVGLLAGLLTRDGIRQFGELEQSALTPPAIVFPIVWVILYAFMGIGAARIWLSPPSEARTRGLWLFVFQLIFNFFWTLFFFNLQAFGFSLIWIVALWLLILAMTIVYYQVDFLAAWFQLPYLIWVTFAAWLNYAAWQLN